MKPPSAQTNRNLFTLVFTIFLDFVGFGIVLPIIAPVILDPVNGVLPAAFSYSSRTITLGLLIGAFPIAQFFGAPILGVLSDKYGRKKILLASISVTAISLTLFGVGVVTRNIYLLFGSRILNGFMGGNVAAAQSAIADMSDMGSKARNFGLIGMAFGMGFVTGPFIGGKLADPHLVSWFNYSTPYWFAAGLSCVNVGLIVLLFRETLKTPRHDVSISFITGMSNLGKAFSNAHLRTMFTVIFLAALGFTFFTQFFQVYVITKFQYNQGDIGEMYAYIGVWIALTQGGLTRVLSRKFHPSQVLTVSLLTMSIALIVLLIPQRSHIIYYVLPFVSMSQGVTNPNATAIISNSVGAGEQGEILGINQSLQSVAFAVTPVIAGVLTSVNVRLPIVIGSVSAFLSWLIYILTIRKKTASIGMYNTE